MMNKKTTILLISLLIIDVLLLYFLLKVFPCEIKYFGWVIGVILIFFPVLLNLILKRYNIGDTRFYIVVIVSLFFGIIYTKNIQKHLSENIKQDGGIVTVGRIYKKHVNYKSPEKLYIKYNNTNEYFTKTFRCSKKIYNSLNVGDTILLVYSLKCNNEAIPFDYFPTPQEIQRCKNGCYYFNGKIVEESPD